MLGKRLINTKVAGGGGCTDIVDNYDPFGDSSGVALYQLNGNATDVSGNYNGTATNVTYGTGVFGQAGVFNGSSSYISGLPTLTNISGSYSISVWAKFTSTPSSNACILGGIKEQGSSDSLITVFVNTSNNIVFRTRGSDAGTIYDIVASSNYLGQWHNIVVTQDSLKMELFIDGASIGTLSVSPTITLDNCVIGASNGRGTLEEYFSGSIDQVRIFNEVLTPLEVEALYTEELCICDGTVDTLDILGDGSCIATYPLDGNANDLSGNYSGTPTDVSYGVGEFDLAGVFNGTNSYIALADGSLNLNTISFSAWIKPTGTGLRHILDNYDFISSTSKGFTFRITAANTLNFQGYFNDSLITRCETTNVVQNDIWTNVSFVLDSGSSSIKIYINGTEANYSLQTYNGITYHANCKTGIGALNSVFGKEFHFNGSIDQVRIFNKALSALEVTTLYNETACTKVTRTAGDTQILGDSSCVAYYKLDGNANDETGNYNGTFTNPNYGNGEFDYAAVFNGSSNYINLPDNSFKLSTITVSAWINSASTQNLQTIYSSYEYQLLQSRGFGIRLQDSNLILFQGYNSNTNSNVFSSSQIQRNTWNHIVVVATQSSVSIYINGSLDNSGSISGFDYFTNHPFSIGKNAQAVEHYFDGSIDQVRIFNRAINAGEVTTLYNEGI